MRTRPMIPHLRRATFTALAFMLAGGGIALADKIKHPRAIFSGLDKITGRIINFEVATDETVQFGSLQITARVCYTRPATEAPQTTSFIEVDEVDSASQFKRIFSGWVYAASPGLSGIEHPVYDIWLNDCKGGTEVIVTPPDAPEPEVADAADLQTKGAKPGTVPKPKKPAAQPPDPFGSPFAAAPPIAGPRQKPTQSFFPTTSSQPVQIGPRADGNPNR